jgi:hypothetical protein
VCIIMFVLFIIVIIVAIAVGCKRSGSKPEATTVPSRTDLYDIAPSVLTKPTSLETVELPPKADLTDLGGLFRSLRRLR